MLFFFYHLKDNYITESKTKNRKMKMQGQFFVFHKWIWSISVVNIKCFRYMCTLPVSHSDSTVAWSRTFSPFFPVADITSWRVKTLNEITQSKMIWLYTQCQGKCVIWAYKLKCVCVGNLNKKKPTVHVHVKIK